MSLKRRLLKLAVVSATLVAAICPTKWARAASGPPTQPILRIEAEMHTARIMSIDTDRQGRFLVTASYDKTARVWDLSTGRLLQILRPPQGERNEGELYSVAISPNGETIAAGGLTGAAWDSRFSIYLFDRASGRVRGRITKLPTAIFDLAYSRDGRYLAAALGGQGGVRVFRTSDGVEVFVDLRYEGTSYSVEFDRQGRLVTTSADGELRLYGADFQRLTRRAAPGGSKPLSARFSPDGALVAVGFQDSSAVNVLSAADLRLAYAPDTKDFSNGTVPVVEWSLEGQRLYAGGMYDDTSVHPIVEWSQAGRGPARRLELPAASRIRGLRALPDGGLVFSDETTAWGVLNARGVSRLLHMLPVLDHRNNSEKLRLSRDGRVAEFGFDTRTGQSLKRSLARIDLGQGQLAVDIKPAADLRGPRTSGLNSLLSARQVSVTLRLNLRSLHVTSDGKRFLLGTDVDLHLRDQNGRQIWRAPTAVDVWAVNSSEDGRFAVAALGDGTIRWYAMEDGRERLALFPHPDGRRWVTWTPEGFFDAGANGEELIGYHLNQGADREGQFVKAEQLSAVFYRPDLVKRRLEGAREGEALIAEAVRRIGDVRRVLTGGLPPRLELLSPAELTQAQGDVLLQFSVQNQGGGIGKIVSRIDGVELEGRPEGIGIPGNDPVRRRFRVGAGDHTVSIEVYNEKGEVASRAIQMKVHVPQSGVRPTLHVLALGVTNYRDRSFQLHYAADDARAFATQLQQRAGGLYERVNVVTPLVDQEVTLAKIEQAFATLATQVKPDDVFVFFAAGHGTARDGEYLFIPWDLVYQNDDGLRKNSLTQAKLKALLSKIVANKSLIVLDTCSAGAFASRGDALENKAAIDRLMKTTGRAVLAATADSKMALEGFEGHGVFTSSLLRGLAGAADRNNDGTVDVNELAAFVATDVPAITRKRWGYEQFPMQDLRGMSFPITRTR